MISPMVTELTGSDVPRVGLTSQSAHTRGHPSSKLASNMPIRKPWQGVWDSVNAKSASLKFCLGLNKTPWDTSGMPRLTWVSQANLI